MGGLILLCALLMVWIVNHILRSLANHWRDGEIGHCALGIGAFFTLLPIYFVATWSPLGIMKIGIPAAAAIVAGIQAVRVGAGREFHCATWSRVGTAFTLAMAALVPTFILLGFAVVFHNLPAMAAAAEGLTPPDWLASYQWAKPAIMIMGLWGAIGSNNMLLYLAGLSNIPPELEEAADIDGASPFQKFWHVVWPQLAPITFFIVVMTVIGGLQGGFEMARTMTQGGPAGSTTTLSYFIYNEGFATGRLGYSSAISWMLFAMVFTVTMINWKFGSKYVND
jgi:multiple sugar transport system permease protein